MTIKEIQNLAIVGDANSDQHIFNECHTFVMDDNNSMKDKIKALKKIDETMGIGSEPTAADVETYIKECKDY